MDDRSSSDCSWKKIVIAKTDNKWSSTIKMEDANDINTTNFSLSENEVILRNIKTEVEVIIEEKSKYNEGSEIEENDPLSLLTPSRIKKPRKVSKQKNEEPEERAARLARMSAYAAQRLANESPEQRALRLRRMSLYAAKRLALETAEQRATRLARMSAYAAKRLANETVEQREARLSRMSAYAAKRHAMKKSIMGNPDKRGKYARGASEITHHYLWTQVAPQVYCQPLWKGRIKEPSFINHPGRGKGNLGTPAHHMKCNSRLLLHVGFQQESSKVLGQPVHSAAMQRGTTT